VAELTTPAHIHGARDAEDRRLLEAGELDVLLEAYYGIILRRCRARIWNDTAVEVAAEIVIRLLSKLRAGVADDVPFRVAVHHVTGEKIAEHLGRHAKVATLYDLAQLLGGLPQPARDVAELRLRDGLEPNELAGRLGLEQNECDEAWRRAKVHLRAKAGLE
jgi:hypothetical protein